MNPRRLLAHFDRIAEAPDAIPRLRRFILDLAVRGKLVEQDPKDEPVEIQLAKSDASRQRTAREDHRADANLQSLLAEEEKWDAPASWKWRGLADLVLFIDYRGQTPNKVEEGVQLITAKNVKKGFISLSPEEFISKATYDAWMTRGLPEHGDVLFTTEAPMGNAAAVRITERFALAQRVINFRIYGAIVPEFLVLQLLSDPFQAILNKTATGLTAKGIKAAKLKRLPMVVPPLAEQLRIVAKVDELMALCDRLEAAQAKRESRRDRLATASLRRVNDPADANAVHFREHVSFHLRHLPRLTVRQEQIQQLRQTLLNLAIRGKLVPQDPNDEPSSLWLGNRKVVLTLENEPWPLPRGWALSSLGKIGQVIGGGTPSKAEPRFWTGTIPWVSPKDMKVDRIRDAQDHITEEAIDNSSAQPIPAGALLMVVRGMILAHSFPTALTMVRVTINQDMKAIVPFRQEMAPMLFLITQGLKPEILRLVQHSTHGTCKLLTDDLFNLPIPIPPLAEQRRIVAKVDEIMALCDRLETRRITVQKGNHRLLEAILHEALRQ